MSIIPSKQKKKSKTKKIKNIKRVSISKQNNVKQELAKEVVTNLLNSDSPGHPLYLDLKTISKLDEHALQYVLKADKNAKHKIKQMLEKTIQENVINFPKGTGDKEILGLFKIFLPCFFDSKERAKLPLSVAIGGEKDTRGSSITDASMCYIATTYKNLENIFLYDCGNVTNKFMHNLSAHCHNLLSAVLHNSCCDLVHMGKHAMQDADVIQLARHCRRLVRIDLSQKVSKLTDAAVINGISLLKDVRAVCLNGANISDYSLESLLNHNKEIRQLSIEECKDERLTVDMIAKFVLGCPMLNFFGLTNSSCNCMWSLSQRLLKLGINNVYRFHYDDDAERATGRKVKVTTNCDYPFNQGYEWLVL
jgi:hypothetical protein